jgi:hypothetical protein
VSKEETKDLLLFLHLFGEEITQKVLWLREFVWNMYPQANELIYDNYNAFAFGWSPTDKVGHTFCSIAVGRSSKNIHFGFYWGNQLTDSDEILQGKGNQYRYILVNDISEFPEKNISDLTKEAYAISLAMVKDQKQIMHGKTIVRSISEKKRERKSKLK